MPHIAVCLKCGKKYEKNELSYDELRSSNLYCYEENCRGDICRTDAWGYPVTEKLRKKGYPILHCYVSNSGNSSSVILAFFGVNLNSQLKDLLSEYVCHDRTDDGTTKMYTFYHNVSSDNKSNLKRSLLVQRKKILTQIEQLADYVH